MRGEFGKELRFKEMGLFSIDLNGEYSADRRYLTVERLDMRWGLLSLSRIDSLKQSLKSLARLANLLGRTAVLPPFPCRRENGEAPFCNVCHFDLPNCFKGVLGQFRSPVRESVFFMNPLVPEAIRRRREAIPSIPSRATAKQPLATNRHSRLASITTVLLYVSRVVLLLNPALTELEEQ